MPAGRPPVFESEDALQDSIDDYFKKGVKERTFILGKAPNQYKVTVPVPTITGLCIYLGFESRQSFYDYEERPEFSYTIKRARLFIENEYEEMLSYGNTTGAIFALKNFGWIDSRDINQNTRIEDKRRNLSKLSNDDLDTLELIYSKIGEGET